MLRTINRFTLQPSSLRIYEYIRKSVSHLYALLFGITCKQKKICPYTNVITQKYMKMPLLRYD